MTALDSILATPLVRRLALVHSNHKRIAASALLIGVLTFVAKLFVAGREVAIAWRYGVSTTVDAYQLGLTIVSWVPMMLVSVITVVFVPQLVSVRGKQEHGRRFIAELNGSVALLGLAVAVLTWLAAPLGAQMLGSEAQRSTTALSTQMGQLMSPAAFLLLCCGYLSARLQARERFSYTLTEALPALVICVVLLLPVSLSAQHRLGFATIAGFGLQLLVLAIMTQRNGGGLGSFSLRHSAPEWSALYRDMAIMTAGQILLTLAVPIDQGFGARLGAGAVATLGYASRILTLLTGLATVIIARALLPVFSRAVAEKQFALGQRQAIQWAGLMFVTALLGTALFWILAPDLVRLLFERGAFGANATAEVSSAVRFGALQLPFFFGGIVLVQWYAANRRYRDILWITVAALAAKVTGNALLAPLLGVRGIMLSTALMYAVTCLLVVGALRRRTKA